MSGFQAAKKLLVACLVWAACALGQARADAPLLVQVPAVLDPGAPIAQAVRKECGVDMLVGNHVLGQLTQRWPEAQALAPAADAGSAKVVRLTLLSVMGAGGGSWSGSKSMTLRAELVQRGRPLHSTVLTRHSTGGAFGGMMGTCAIMERIAVALGKDASAWLGTALKAPGVQDVPSPDAPAPSAGAPVAKD